MGAKGNLREPRPEISVPDIEYRQLQALNYSGLKLFDESPSKFYKQYVLGEKRIDTPSSAIIIGQLVDFYLLDCQADENEFTQRFDEKFCLFEGSKNTSQAFLFADYIWESMQKETNGTLKGHMSNAFIRCQKEGKYQNKTLEWAIDNFEDSPADEYLQKRLKSVDKMVVTNFQLSKCRYIADQLLNDEWTKDIYNPPSHIELYQKMPIEWEYETLLLGNVAMKSELDLFHVLHDEKQIYIKDNKCTYDNEGFEYSYLKHYYYIQNTVYHCAMNYWKDHNDMEDYKIIGGLEFIVSDTSSDNRRPLRYTTTLKHILEGMKGFTFNRQKYRGVESLINEIAWCKSEGIWNISSETFYNNGKLSLRTFNEE